MGLILDTGILIASERRGEFIDDTLLRLKALTPETDIAISAVTVVELTHGIYGAQTKRNDNGGASSWRERSNPYTCIPYTRNRATRGEDRRRTGRTRQLYSF